MWNGMVAILVACAVLASAAAADEPAAPGSRLVIEGLRAGPALTVDLELTRFTVTAPGARFVVGSRTGSDDRALAFDPASVALYRGSVRGRPLSHAFLTITPRGARGFVDLGTGPEGHYVIGGSGRAGDPFALAAAPAAPGMVPPGVPLCGLEHDEDFARAAAPVGGSAGVLTYRTKVIELAVETDYELYSLFGDLDATAAYVVELYGAVNDIYLRDVNCRFVLTFVRLWDDPDDLFNEQSPLVPFRDHWNDKMADVPRDAAQFISGRRDMPYGGAAYLSALCSPFSYSVVGYLLGVLPDPSVPSAWGYDIGVVAHELGHNCGALHTHNYGLDNCDQLDNTPQRGSIMSYCSQTVSGGNAVTDLFLHSVPEDFIREHVGKSECLISDCNGNDQDDADDVALGSSSDANGNGVPDECEDCNGNGTLDPADIAGGGSDDLNGNGIPDECEDDCNGNGQPDDLDIDLGISTDAWGNGVPDECETDCDDDGLSDFSEIQDDLTLDIDRNAALDGCQDCDGDGINDILALDGERFCWVASQVAGEPAAQFHPVSGVRSLQSQGSAVNGGYDLLVSSAGEIYVSSFEDDRVAHFNRFGQSLGTFVSAGAGGLNGPSGLLFKPGGNLLVASRNSNAVLEFDGDSGLPVGAFVTAGSGGLIQPHGLVFGPDGNLYVTSNDGRVLEYDGSSGAFLGAFVTSAGNGGLTAPRGLLFLPSGNLLVASHGTNELLEYDGTSGAFLGKWNHNGTENALTLDGPWGLRLGPDGHVYVSRNILPSGQKEPDSHDEGILGTHEIIHLHINSTRLYIFDAATGNFLRSYITGNDTGLPAPTGFDFMIDLGIDCNRNLLPDSCDLASGASQDVNGNGVPDECECVGDIDGSGEVDVQDLVAVILSFGECRGACPADVDGDGEVDVPDLVLVVLNWGECS